MEVSDNNLVQAVENLKFVDGDFDNEHMVEEVKRFPDNKKFVD